MSLDFEGALAGDNGESQIEFALGIDARRQSVELKSEVCMACWRAWRGRGDGQRPFRRWSFDEQLNRLTSRRRKIDRDQRLGRRVDAFGGQADLRGWRRLGNACLRRYKDRVARA